MGVPPVPSSHDGGLVYVGKEVDSAVNECLLLLVTLSNFLSLYT